MNSWFQIARIAMFVYSFFFFGTVTYAETRCCVDGYKDKSECRVTNDFCNIAPAFPSAADYNRFCLSNPRESICWTLQPQNYINSVNTPTEKEVSCASEIKCREAVKLITKCGTLTGSLLCSSNPNCFWFDGCFNRSDRTICHEINRREYCEQVDGKRIGSEVCKWDESQNRCMTLEEDQLSSQYTKSGGILPACAYAGNCKGVNSIIGVVLAIVKEAFKYIGSLAFAFFIYGGVTMILSFGNPEKFKHGQQIIVAAVIGLVISFSAFALVGFILNTLAASNQAVF